jgi:hypothetical protein
MPNGAA